jgi:hypothetical protein
METNQRLCVPASHLPARVIKFYKKTGDPVSKTEPILVYEYDERREVPDPENEQGTIRIVEKFTTELLSKYEGKIHSILVRVDDVIRQPT